MKSWAVLDRVEVQNMAVDKAAANENIVKALALGLPELDWLPEWGKWKGAEPIAIVGSGPSLRYTIAGLAAFRTILVAGSAHDFVVSRGVKPTYCAVVDPTPEITESYIQHPQPTCNYLLASQCDPGLFKHLEHYPVTLWHCGGEINGESVLAGVVPDDRVTVKAGGCTIGLRSIALANGLGYYELHLFGMDSCLDPNDEKTHAFDLQNPEVEFKQGNGAQVLKMKVGKDVETARTFYVPSYLISQAWDFERMLKTSRGAANFTVHGDGLFAEMVRLYHQANPRAG